MKRTTLLLGLGGAALLLAGLGFAHSRRQRPAEPPRNAAGGWNAAYQYRQGQPIHWRHWLLKR